MRCSPSLPWLPQTRPGVYSSFCAELAVVTEERAVSISVKVKAFSKSGHCRILSKFWYIVVIVDVPARLQSQVSSTTDSATAAPGFRLTCLEAVQFESVMSESTSLFSSTGGDTGSLTKASLLRWWISICLFFLKLLGTCIRQATRSQVLYQQPHFGTRFDDHWLLCLHFLLPTGLMLSLR